MRVIITLVLSLLLTSCHAQTSLDKQILKLQNPKFGLVYEVMDSIINSGEAAIPKLITLLKDTSYVKLQNTADLIYPGADQFYGHGWIINYDLDWISVRAAWLLEEITFQDFGFRDLTINEEKLMKLHQADYQTYITTGSHPVDFKNKTKRNQLILYRLMLADSVQVWWEKNQNSWTRYRALKDALSSLNIQQQSSALQYLRVGKTNCDGLTKDKYQTELKPLIEKIKASNSNESEQAKYLLQEGFVWPKTAIKR